MSPLVKITLLASWKDYSTNEPLDTKDTMRILKNTLASFSKITL